jgi:hypothetical protein
MIAVEEEDKDFEDCAGATFETSSVRWADVSRMSGSATITPESAAFVFISASNSGVFGAGAMREYAAAPAIARAHSIGTQSETRRFTGSLNLIYYNVLPW